MRRRIAIGATCVALSASVGGGAVASAGPQADSALSKRGCEKLLKKIQRAGEKGQLNKVERLSERFVDKGCPEKLA